MKPILERHFTPLQSPTIASISVSGDKSGQHHAMITCREGVTVSRSSNMATSALSFDSDILVNMPFFSTAGTSNTLGPIEGQTVKINNVDPDAILSQLAAGLSGNHLLADTAQVVTYEEMARTGRTPSELGLLRLSSEPIHSATGNGIVGQIHHLTSNWADRNIQLRFTASPKQPMGETDILASPIMQDTHNIRAALANVGTKPPTYFGDGIASGYHIAATPEAVIDAIREAAALPRFLLDEMASTVHSLRNTGHVATVEAGRAFRNASLSP